MIGKALGKIGNIIYKVSMFPYNKLELTDIENNTNRRIITDISHRFLTKLLLLQDTISIYYAQSSLNRSFRMSKLNSNRR